MARCQAEVRHLVAAPGQRYRGSTGSRQINEYEFVQCSRQATSIPVKMYPPRDDLGSGMQSTTGVVCGQHGRHWLPRKAVGA